MGNTSWSGVEDLVDIIWNFLILVISDVVVSEVVHGLVDLLVVSQLAQVLLVGVIDQFALSDQSNVETTVDDNDEDRGDIAHCDDKFWLVLHEESLAGDVSESDASSSEANRDEDLVSAVESDSVIEDDSSHVQPGLERNWVGEVDCWENLVLDSRDLSWAQHLPELLQTEVNSIVIEVSSSEESKGEEENETHHQGSDEENNDFLPLISTVVGSDNQSGETWQAEPNKGKQDSEWSDIPVSSVLGVHGQQVVQNRSTVVVLDIGFLVWNLIASVSLAVIANNFGIVKSVGNGLTWWVNETDLESGDIDHLSSDSVLELSLDNMVILLIP
jgi:hypothetical protein